MIFEMIEYFEPCHEWETYYKSNIVHRRDSLLKVLMNEDIHHVDREWLISNLLNLATETSIYQVTIWPTTLSFNRSHRPYGSDWHDFEIKKLVPFLEHIWYHRDWNEEEETA